MGAAVSVRKDASKEDVALSRPSRKAWCTVDNTMTGPLGFLLKEQVQCLCEGGRFCVKENPAKQRGANAVLGLHSSWVGEHVLAMARPWQDNVLKHGVIESFRNQGVGMVLNLQEVGEHHECGPGNLHASGFTYDPETFMASGIRFYNFSWRDMGVPCLDKMMDIAQVMQDAVDSHHHKVAVHCHAGLGRTGLAIACFLCFSGRAVPEEAVRMVREGRPGALQTSAQVAFVTVFQQYLRWLRCQFNATSAPLPNLATTSMPIPALPRSNSQQLRPSPSLSRRSTPLTVETDDLVDVKFTGTHRIETYRSGVTLVRPLSMGLPPAADDGSSDASDQELPWTKTMHMKPQVCKEWEPERPRSYAEALKRQQRLLHGNERRSLLHLHKFVKELVFVVVEAARDALPQGPEGEGAPPKSTPMPFSNALMLAVRKFQPKSEEVLIPPDVAARAEMRAVLGSHCELAADLAALRHEVDGGKLSCLQGASPAVLALLMQQWFQGFRHPSLSSITLAHLQSIHPQLPARPGKEQASSSSAPSEPISASAALHPLHSSDQELLLLFSALLRHLRNISTVAGSAGVEELCHWLATLLTWPSTGTQTVSAVDATLWYITTNSTAYKTLYAQRKKKRIPEPASSTPTSPGPSPAAQPSQLSKTTGQCDTQHPSPPKADSPGKAQHSAGSADCELDRLLSTFLHNQSQESAIIPGAVPGPGDAAAAAAAAASTLRTSHATWDIANAPPLSLSAMSDLVGTDAEKAALEMLVAAGYGSAPPSRRVSTSSHCSLAPRSTTPVSPEMMQTPRYPAGPNDAAPAAGSTSRQPLIAKALPTIHREPRRSMEGGMGGAQAALSRQSPAPSRHRRTASTPENELAAVIQQEGGLASSGSMPDLQPLHARAARGLLPKLDVLPGLRPMDAAGPGPRPSLLGAPPLPSPTSCTAAPIPDSPEPQAPRQASAPTTGPEFPGKEGKAGTTTDPSDPGAQQPAGPSAGGTSPAASVAKQPQPQPQPASQARPGSKSPRNSQLSPRVPELSPRVKGGASVGVEVQRSPRGTLRAPLASKEVGGVTAVA